MPLPRAAHFRVRRPELLLTAWQPFRYDRDLPMKLRWSLLQTDQLLPTRKSQIRRRRSATCFSHKPRNVDRSLRKATRSTDQSEDVRQLARQDSSRPQRRQELPASSESRPQRSSRGSLAEPLCSLVLDQGWLAALGRVRRLLFSCICQVMSYCEE